MATAAVKVEGLVEFQRALRAADKKLPRELGAGNKQVAEIVAKEARKRAPNRSGRLAKSIKGAKQQRRAVVQAGSPSRVPYAAVQEFGWPARGIAPQPYLYPAIADTREEVEEAYGDMIDRLMRRAFPDRSAGADVPVTDLA